VRELAGQEALALLGGVARADVAEDDLDHEAPSSRTAAAAASTGNGVPSSRR
jgi:hypothetical protein